jgi:hypothetical protein
MNEMMKTPTVPVQPKEDKSFHYCKDHVDGNCVCRICGETHHDTEDDDDGTFAMSGKIVTAYCKRCRKEWRYYADTGTDV